MWTADEAAELLRGTVREDRGVMLEDWKESIEPLQDQIGSQFERFFGFEDYLAARTLIASRSFQVDDHYHGVGMVPLADIFNHKTGAEDVHLSTSASTEDDSESEAAESGGKEVDESADESSTTSAGPHWITGNGVGFKPDILDMDIMERVLEVKSEDAVNMARQLALREGLMVGISSAANTVAALELAKKPENKGKLIVTIHASFGERYLSSVLFEELRKEAENMQPVSVD